MGKRFLALRYHLERYSGRRASLRLNEGDYEPHQMRPYGMESGNFVYRQLFAKKHASRHGNRQEQRVVKKAARQQGRRTLREDEEEQRGNRDGSEEIHLLGIQR